MVNAYDTLSDGQQWTHTLQNEVGTALGAVDSVGFYPLQPPSYTIFVTGSTYYRRDGLNGAIDDSSTNFSTLLSNALNESDCQLLFLKKGTYTANDAVSYDGNQKTIMGEVKRATKIVSGLGAGEDLFTFGTAGGTSRSFINLRNLELEGNGSEQHAVVWYNYTRDLLAWNVEVDSFGGDAFHVEGSFGSTIDQCFLHGNNRGITLQQSSAPQKPNAFTIKNCFIESDGDVGVLIDENTPNSVWMFHNVIQSQTSHGVHAKKVTNLQIINNYFESNGGDAILLQHPSDQTSRSSGSRIINNMFTGAIGNYAINIDNGNNTFISNNHYNNTIGGSGNYHIDIASTSLNTLILERSGSEYGLSNSRINGANANGNVRLFLGCENSGTSTGTGATQNIEHYLPTTPNRIAFGQTSVGTGYPVQTSGANATYIFVSAGSGVTYDWHTWLA